MASKHAEQAGVQSGASEQVDRSQWRYVADMELPAEMQQEVERTYQRYGARKPHERRPLEEAIKLQYFFGGQDVATMLTPRGTVIVCVGDHTSAELRAILDALPPDVRCQVTIDFPPKWNDASESWI
jgi:hypothetical protein